MKLEMLTTTPHLLIRRPSPTTAEFIVTTQRPDSLSLRIANALVAVSRIVVLCVLLLTGYAVWLRERHRLGSSWAAAHECALHKSLSLSLNSSLCSLEAALQHTAAGIFLTQLAGAAPAPAVLAALVLVGCALTLRTHRRESLLVLRGLGVQTSESAGTILGRARTRFIPTEKIQDVLVNEAFLGFEVRYYLTVVVEGDHHTHAKAGDALVVVFPGLLPGREIVEAVWRGVRECLYEKGS